MIAILDQTTLGAASQAPMLANPDAFVAAATRASQCLVHPPPLQNDSQRGSYTFHLNFATYQTASPHWFQIDIGDGALIGQHKYPYASMLFTQPASLPHTIAPNETTYVKITLGRTSDAAFAIYSSEPGLNLTLAFPPFDPQDRLVP
jgi:hypothetical protein